MPMSTSFYAKSDQMTVNVSVADFRQYASDSEMLFAAMVNIARRYQDITGESRYGMLTAVDENLKAESFVPMHSDITWLNTSTGTETKTDRLRTGVYTWNPISDYYAGPFATKSDAFYYLSQSDGDEGETVVVLDADPIRVERRRRETDYTPVLPGIEPYIDMMLDIIKNWGDDGLGSKIEAGIELLEVLLQAETKPAAEVVSDIIFKKD